MRFATVKHLIGQSTYNEVLSSALKMNRICRKIWSGLTSFTILFHCILGDNKT